MIKSRKKYPVISEGSYEAFLPEHPQIYGYIRRLADHSLLVLNNFFPQETTIELPEEFSAGEILIDNYQTETYNKKLVLKPYQTIAIYR